MREILMLVMELLGTVAFAVSGTLVAAAAGLDLFGVLTVGAITSVGGGVLRDVLVNEKPYILVKHIYAVASLIGAMVYYRVGIYWGHELIGTIISVLLTITIRMLAAKFRWNLPKVM